ncbi:NAD(P)H-dependent FMN reductase PA1204 [uncultured Gammaproteobacteria bacterium]
MPTPIHILGFSGSLRRGSCNSALLRVAAGVLPEKVTLEIYDLASIPLYNGDLESEGLPVAVLEFRARIKAADALLVATPEYNYSIPGVLKNAIDWASRPPEQPFDGKPLAMMGTAGGLGGARAQYHLRQVLVCLNAHALNKPEVQIPRAWEKFDQNGTPTDPEIAKSVASLVQALAGWTRTLRGEG